MNIELYLENKRVEVDNVQFPLNKVYEDTSKPTDLISDYSKTVSIPMTKNNNMVLGNIYRIDKAIYVSNENIGLYLDPARKIAFKLMYNSDVFMEGYAKFNSSVMNNKGGFYHITLYGTLGEIFQKLRDVVVDKDQLEDDKGEEYVLNDYLSHNAFNINEVEYSWNTYRYREVDPIGTNSDFDIIGLAPSYRGLYSDFDSSKYETLVPSKSESGVVVTVPGTIPYEDTIRKEWLKKVKLTHPGQTEDWYNNYVEALGPDKVSTFKDYQVNEYRLNELKPYIYIHSLFEMFKYKSYQLTGYDLELDPVWCNVTNPYWSRMCYFFNFFHDGRNSDKKSYTINQGFKNTFTQDMYDLQVDTHKFNVDISSIGGTTDFVLNEHKVTLRAVFKNRATASLAPKMRVGSGPIVLKYKYRTPEGKFNTLTLWFDGADDARNLTDRLLKMGCAENTHYKWNDVPDTTATRTTTTKLLILNVPKLNFEHLADKQYPLEITMLLVHNETSTGAIMPNFYNGAYAEDTDIDNKWQWVPVQLPVEYNNQDFTYQFSDLKADVGWRSTVNASLSSMYKGKEPIFNILLQYSKMFNLMWTVDNTKKIIKLTPKGSYFKDFTVTDWSNKVDYSKDFVVEPMTFSTKYVLFNYEDVEGNNYTAYKNQYKVPIGQKTLATHYEFNSEDTKLFDKIHPSNVSTKSFSSYDQILNWSTEGYIPNSFDTYSDMPYLRIDAEDEETEKAITINNWYLIDDPIYIRDENIILTKDTPYQLRNKCCYIEPRYAIRNNYGVYVNAMPVFTTAFKFFDNFYGCIFNQPNVDYTLDKVVTAAGSNFIYDKCWKDYLNERYSIQNKKVTCYMNLTPNDWVNFEYKNFIIVNNQLFMVNKIFDYNPSITEPTKVELIQVTDPYAYGQEDWLTKIKASKYSIVATDADIKPDQLVYYTSIRFTGYPTDFNVGVAPSDLSKIEIADIERFPEYTEVTVGINKGVSYKGKLHVDNGVEELNIPILFNV